MHTREAFAKAKQDFRFGEKKAGIQYFPAFRQKKVEVLLKKSFIFSEKQANFAWWTTAMEKSLCVIPPSLDRLISADNVFLK